MITVGSCDRNYHRFLYIIPLIRSDIDGRRIQTVSWRLYSALTNYLFMVSVNLFCCNFVFFIITDFFKKCKLAKRLDFLCLFMEETLFLFAPTPITLLIGLNPMRLWGQRDFWKCHKKDGLTIYLPLSIRPVLFHILHHRSPVIIRHIAPKPIIQLLYRQFLLLHSQKLRIRCADKGHKC